MRQKSERNVSRIERKIGAIIQTRRISHRDVCTKLEKQAIELIANPESDNLQKMQGDCQTTRSKIMKLLSEIDGEILNVCDVGDIQHEIEEAAAISDRILDAVRIIDKKTKATEGKVDSTKTRVSSPSTSLHQPDELQSIESNNQNVQNSSSNSNSNNEENTVIKWQWYKRGWKQFVLVQLKANSKYLACTFSC